MRFFDWFCFECVGDVAKILWSTISIPTACGMER